MTKPVNLYLLSRIPGRDAFNNVYHHAAEMPPGKMTPIHEIESLRIFANRMIEEGVPVKALDGYVFGYSIPRIGKEFDLLKFGLDGCLNIELKSMPVPLEQMRTQLRKNRHYLAHLGMATDLYTFVSDTQQCFHLTESDQLETVSYETLAKAVLAVAGRYQTEIDGLFRPSEYIVSPMNTPEKFLMREYFLTQAQEQVRTNLLEAMGQTTGHAVFSLTGKPGTGKTLLLYDIGRTLSALAPVVILHWGEGEIPEGLQLISTADDRLDILPWSVMNPEIAESVPAGAAPDAKAGAAATSGPAAKAGAPGAPATAAEVLNSDPRTQKSGASGTPASAAEDGRVLPALASYTYVLVDESHRLTPLQLRSICRTARKYRQRVIFSQDPEQILTTKERANNIAGLIEALPPTAAFILSERLRGNPDLQSFIRLVYNLNDRPATRMNYRDVDLCYASTIAEAQNLLDYYVSQGYIFINYLKTAHPQWEEILPEEALPVTDSGSSADASGSSGSTPDSGLPASASGATGSVSADPETLNPSSTDTTPAAADSDSMSASTAADSDSMSAAAATDPGSMSAAPDSSNPAAADSAESSQPLFFDNPFIDYEGGYDIHHVIGQEFDRVVMLLDDSFRYSEDGKLEGVPRPDPDYLYPNLFYQGITRVQEKLSLIILENEDLFTTISNLLE